MLQRRAPGKDTWPGRFDVSVGGHYRSGEGIEGCLRELREELGLDVAAERLVPLGRRRIEQRYADGRVDREVQDVYLVVCALPLEEYRPDPGEVDAVVAVPLGEFVEVARGALAEMSGEGMVWSELGGWRMAWVRVRAGDLVPSEDGYYRWVGEAARRHLGDG